MTFFLSKGKKIDLSEAVLSRELHLPMRGARTGQASKEETGEVPVTGREGEEGSRREGEQRNQAVTRETTFAQISFKTDQDSCEISLCHRGRIPY